MPLPKHVFDQVVVTIESLTILTEQLKIQIEQEKKLMMVLGRYETPLGHGIKKMQRLFEDSQDRVIMLKHYLFLYE